MTAEHSWENSPRQRLFGGAVLFAVLVACAVAPDAPPPHAAAPSAAAAPRAVSASRTAGSSPGVAPSPNVETSVRPGVNDAYRDPDVAQWVGRFERSGREIYDRREAIVAALGLRPAMVVADVGAGTGLFEPLLAARVAPAGRVLAVDIVPEFLAHIRERCEALGISNVETVRSTERSVELPAASVDVALLCDVYHHLEYPRSTMGSIRRALRPGGSLVVIDFERVEGKSSDWVLGHVRAGRDVVVREIEAAGFRLDESLDLLETNYVLRFRPR